MIIVCFRYFLLLNFKYKNMMENNKFEIGQKVIDDIFFGDGVIGEIMDVEYNEHSAILKVSFGTTIYRYFGDGIFIGDNRDNRILTVKPTLKHIDDDKIIDKIIDYEKFVDKMGNFWNDDKSDMVSSKLIGFLEDSAYPFETEINDKYKQFKNFEII